MAFWLFVILFMTPDLMEGTESPLEETVGEERRALDCEPLSMDGARHYAPGELGESSPRGDFFDRRAVVCRERIMSSSVRRSDDDAGQGLRGPQDDAVMLGLRHTARELASLVGQLTPFEQQRTWLVEAHYPGTAVSQKITFAVKNELLDRGFRVTDRAPTLAVGDIEVLGQLDPARAYPLACERYVATGSLRPGDVLLAVVLRDPRETALHAGLCVDGKWRWLR